MHSISMDKIFLNDILKFESLDNIKVRFNLMLDNNWNPIEIFKTRDFDTLLRGQYWNYKTKKSYKEGQITIGFIKIANNEDLWLLFHIGTVTKDLNKLDGVGFEFEQNSELEKYFGRLIIKYKNKAQTMIRKASSVFEECEVIQLLPDTFDNDIFPGYDKVNISWKELSRVISKESWKTALQNQKGVYLITDTSCGKMYVGSAYGGNMILGRWQSYVKNGNGGNVELKKLSLEHIQEFFRYSILDIFKSTTDDNVIIERESWWKETLLTRKFGYNIN